MQRRPMGYVYAGMYYRAKEEMRKEVMKREDYMVYWNIIRSLVGAEMECVSSCCRILSQSCLYDCIERLVPDTNVQVNIIKEINSYKNAFSDFGKAVAIRTREETMLPGKVLAGIWNL